VLVISNPQLDTKQVNYNYNYRLISYHYFFQLQSATRNSLQFNYNNNVIDLCLALCTVQPQYVGLDVFRFFFVTALAAGS